MRLTWIKSSMAFHSSPGIKIERKKGEKFRRALAEMKALDRSKKIRSDDYFVYLPILADSVNDDKLAEISDYEVIDGDFELEPIIATPESILGYRPCYEVIGDIAIVEGEDPDRVAAALLSTCSNIRSVITPISDVEGEFRTRRFRHVAGEDRKTTLHKEHGQRYLVDLEGAYFTPRLGTERLRISRLVCPGDFVLDMFAGVGPFAILLAQKGAKVVAIDKNPVAVKYLRNNALLNKVELEILEGDARELSLNYENKADHIIMNLPQTANEFLSSAFRAVKDGGVVHYYAISPETDLYCDLKLIENVAAPLGAKVEVLYKGIVRSYAPHRYNVVIDFRVCKPN
jgi:tRNA (guanine37-N1)-methyltransferase